MPKAIADIVIRIMLIALPLCLLAGCTILEFLECRWIAFKSYSNKSRGARIRLE
jgi:hypothetical protein